MEDLSISVYSTKDSFIRRMGSGKPTKMDFKLKFLMTILFLMQLINSMDRGYISANTDTFTQSLSLTGWQAGSLNSAFIAGMLLSIPPMTYIAQKFDRPFILMSSGFAVWAGATFIASFAKGYAHLITCRVFVGIGDALFAIIAVPFVDYNAPVESRGSIMALFLCLYPIGIAFGIGMAGAIPNWRTGFIVEACLMVPLVIAGYLINFRQDLSEQHENQRKESTEVDGEIQEGETKPLLNATSQFTELLNVLSNILIWLGCLGFAALMGVSASLGVWIIPYSRIIFGKEKSVAAPLFAVIIASASIFGNVFGGKLLDCLGKRQGGKSCTLAFFQCGFFSLIAVPITILSFSVSNWDLFLFLNFAGLFFLTTSGATFSLATLWTVEVRHRVLASSLISIIMNLCGTVPLPVLTGVLKGDDPDTFEKWVMITLGLWLIWPTIFAFICGVHARRRGIGTNVDRE